MLEKSMYDSWTRPMKYFELTEAQQLQDNHDVQETNIILHGLPPDMYALVNHKEVAKDIWDRVKLLMKDTELSYQERECRLYNLFDKFAYVPGETLKFVTDMKLAKSLYTTNYDQLYAYLSQHERHANEVRITRERYPDPLALCFAGTGNKGIATTSRGNYAASKPKVVKCYNCQGEGHMVRQCTQPKRPRNAALFKEKLMLAEAPEAGQILDKEQLAFLADLGISEAPVAQQTIPQNLAFQTEDLDAYGSDCDDLSSTKVVLMANLSSCDPEVLSEVPYSNSYLNDMINQDVQEMQYSEQTHIDDFQDNEIHSDSNIIRNAKLVGFQPEIDKLKETLSNQVKEKESLSKTLTVFKIESKEKESKYIDKEIVLEKQNKELENTICKMYRSTQAMHMLTKPQSVIAKEHVVIFVIDDEETLILEEESRSKMLDKQNDPISIEKKIKISPIDYSKLNKIKEDFGKHFVTQKELSAEQAFWLKHSSLSETSVKSHTHVRVEAPSKLPKRLTSDAITTGSWGFEHTKECFVTKIIPFLTVLKDTFNAFDKTLLDEITKVQTVFNQIEAAVDQCSVDKNIFEIQIKQLRIDNDQLLNQIMSQEIVHIVANSMDILDVKKSRVNDSQSQEKDTVIRKLKEIIKSLSGKDSVKNVKKDIDEIETINIELEHSVAKLLLENENLRKEREHLKSIYKDQFDSIRKIRVQSKEHCDSVISQIIAKSAENSDLNDQLQKKVFAITALKNELRKPKGKNVADTTVSKPNVTIAPGMLKLDIEPIS
ncbi:copia protein [Tanacetum coccineum]